MKKRVVVLSPPFVILLKAKSLLNLSWLVLIAILLAGCETTTQSRALLASNDARVTGHKATFTNAVTIVMAPADQMAEAKWKNELIIPAGPTRLAIRYQSLMNIGLIGAIAEEYNVAEVAFEAEAGHEYHAEMSGKTIFNMGYKITDKATGKIVGEAKVKSKTSNKPVEDTARQADAAKD
ncbi:MAG: hypothetical protein JNG82_03155 [Opitutaceae bacterium]|nr:hypothetical protein [Opitutaceae bacterium]